jgi:hypothetical protein
MTHADDPIAFELFRNAIFSIADEMALTIFRTTYSGVLKDNMDYSTAFCDRDGKLVAQGLTLPGHLGAVPTELEVVVARYRRRHASARHLRLQAALLRGTIYGSACLPSNWRIFSRARSTPSRQRALTDTYGGYCAEVRITATPQVGQECCPPVALRQI